MSSNPYVESNFSFSPSLSLYRDNWPVGYGNEERSSPPRLTLVSQSSGTPPGVNYLTDCYETYLPLYTTGQSVASPSTDGQYGDHSVLTGSRFETGIWSATSLTDETAVPPDNWELSMFSQPQEGQSFSLGMGSVFTGNPALNEPVYSSHATSNFRPVSLNNLSEPNNCAFSPRNDQSLLLDVVDLWQDLFGGKPAGLPPLSAAVHDNDHLIYGGSTVNTSPSLHANYHDCENNHGRAPTYMTPEQPYDPSTTRSSMNDSSFAQTLPAPPQHSCLVPPSAPIHNEFPIFIFPQATPAVPLQANHRFMNVVTNVHPSGRKNNTKPPPRVIPSIRFDSTYALGDGLLCDDAFNCGWEACTFSTFASDSDSVDDQRQFQTRVSSHIKQHIDTWSLDGCLWHGCTYSVKGVQRDNDRHFKTHLAWYWFCPKCGKRHARKDSHKRCDAGAGTGESLAMERPAKRRRTSEEDESAGAGYGN